MAKTKSPKTVLLFVMNSKGGVGKSYLAYCIAQVLKILGVKNLEVIEADPETLTITRSLGKENVSDIKLADYDEKTKITRLKQASFDEVLDLIGQANDSGESGVVLVDIGSNLYSQAVEYMRQIDIEKSVQLAGGEFWISSVADMSTMEAAPTCASIEDLCSTFHNILVMDNNYKGDSRERFKITAELDPIEVLEYTRVAPQIVEATKMAMSTKGISSIMQASTSTDIPYSKRAWLKQLYEILFDKESGLFTNSAVMKRIAEIGKGNDVEPIVDFHGRLRGELPVKETADEVANEK